MKRTAAGYKLLCLPLLLLILLSSWRAGAQTTVSGIVKDVQGNPMSGVTVIEKGRTTAASTDEAGKYNLSVSSLTGTLVFSYTGHQTQEIAINGRTTINIALEKTDSKLDEVVVIGYGKQSREKITTNVSKLDQRTLENVPYPNPLSAVQGSVSGVRVQSWSGQPGVAPRIILRGGTTINNPNGAAPLYIVDGVIRSNIDDIAADDIESLQILKDAAATAIYGARASNGVVLVTTRSGKDGIARINYSYDINFADAGTQLREYTNAEEYIRYARQSILWTGVKLPSATTTSRLQSATGYGTGNDLTKGTAFTPQYLTPQNEYKLQEGWSSMPDPADPTKTIIFKETDFQSLTYQTAITHNHYISASGGNEKVKYNGSVGYLDAEGIGLNSDYKRLTASFNSSLQVRKNIRVDGRVLYANTDYRFINGDPQAQFSTLTNTFYRSPSLPSTAKYQFEDGTIAPGQSNSAGNPHYYQTGPYALQAKNTRQKLTIAVGGRWDIMPGLYFEPQVSSHQDQNFGRSFQPAFLSNVTTLNSTRAASQSYSNTRTWQADATLTYGKVFDGHNVEAKVGYSYFNRKTWGVTAAGDGATTDLIPTVNAASTPRTTTGSEGQFVTEGVFARINYDYEARYLLSLTARLDGASSLGAANRTGFFPGVSAGWNLHREKFWEFMPQVISNFKIRASYGENGNVQNLSEFGWQGLFNVGARYGGGGAITPGAIPNPDIQWEQTRVFDGGFELGLFKNRINVTFAYYDRVTDNLITNVSLPTSSGYGSVQTNNGSLGNKGVELDLNLNVLAPTSKLQWSVNFNASKVKTVVLKLPNNGVEGNRIGGVNIWDPVSKAYVWRPGFGAGSVFGDPNSYMEGYRIGDMFAFKQIGVYATDEAAANAPLDMSAAVDQVNPANGRKKYGGDVNWADLDENGIIDSRDLVYVGNMFPTWTGGFSNYFTYKGFNLNIRTDFTLGHTIYNYAKVVADGQLQGDLMPTKDYIEKSWKKQGDITDVPRYLWQNSQGNISRNSTYYEKGDFLCIREVSIGYTFPSTLLRKINVSNLRVHVTGNNLYYITKYRGPNPEDGGADNGRYPNARNLTIGANLTF
jgi:TonB-linked SusC/RagA family outer membrane protein